MQHRAAIAFRFALGLGRDAGSEHFVQALCAVMSKLAQRIVELDFKSPTIRPVIKRTPTDAAGNIEHLFQAQSLCAKLHFV